MLYLSLGTRTQELDNLAQSQFPGLLVVPSLLATQLHLRGLTKAFIPMVPHQQGRSNQHGFPNVALQRLPRQRLTPALALEQPPAMSEEEFNGFFELHFKTAVRDQGKFNSCWAVQTANLIEENSKLNGAVVGQRWRLSAQALINCLPAVYDNGKHLRIWSRSEKEDCYMCSTHDALHFVQ